MGFLSNKIWVRIFLSHPGSKVGQTRLWIKSWANQTWLKCCMTNMAVKNCNGHFSKLIREVYQKCRNLLTEPGKWKRNVLFLCRRTEGSRVPLWRPWRTTSSGTRTTVWEPLDWSIQICRDSSRKRANLEIFLSSLFLASHLSQWKT